MPHRLYIVDVFAERAYTGNPLAVVVGADDLPDDTMQQLAAEMNYSETTFVRSARKELQNLDPPVARRILKEIEALVADPRPVGVVKLEGARNQAISAPASVSNVTGTCPAARSSRTALASSGAT